MTLERDRVIEAFAEVIGADAAATLDRLLPRRPWRESLSDRDLVVLMPDYLESEPERRRIYVALVQAIGDDSADAAMEYLPPVRWKVLRRLGMTGRFW